ncbi:iron dependent repressor, metal binding and dimerization domain protein [Clostridium formicaceticum]|uniref:Manganese transport regulator n=1 Tax=Clostridium formicaceticum TaxID=1497 RepID=A0AAC9WFF8_9CLOT|nr:iron dependent repressor, metal binding and dimerization domain protein [Clostridium formicaceticum]AOY76282.1 DtxR family transcriptional regulator [Clostridium formicaceticum]ARE86669.1 Transcriptional regulator MntR [Clostridium formicaceticum]
MNNKEKYRTVRGYELLKRDKEQLTHSMEDYMEMIYRNAMKDGYIRMNVLAEQLNVQVSSATKMVQKLARLGLLHYQKYGLVHLTDRGKEIGNFLLHRHNIILEFLKLLGVEDRILANTEVIEHGVNVDVLKYIHLLNRFFHSDPSVKEKFEAFKETYGHN